MAYQYIPGPGSGSGSSSSSGFQFFNSPFGDTTYTKVFVGGLAWETQSDTMHHYFEQFGEILEAVVITDRITGRSKGYGFVTFRDPEAARRACIDPSPVIDGRRANCNLAALGRPRPPSFYGHVRTVVPNIGSLHGTTEAYIASSSYHQPVPYSYQQGFPYTPYGYTAYGPEYVSPQGFYSPYMPQQYLQIYGTPGTVAPAVYPFGQFRQPLSENQGYTAVHGYTMPEHNTVQFTGPNINGMTATLIPAIQGPYPAAVVAAPFQAHPRFLVPAHSPEFTQGSGSDRTAD